LPRFSRITITEAVGSLEYLSHAEIDRLLLKFGLEEVAPKRFGSKVSRLNMLIKYLIDNPDAKGPFGANLTLEIIEEVITARPYDSSFGLSARSIEEQLPKLVNSLKRDGYCVVNNQLKTMLPQSIQLAEKEDELNSLLEKLGFGTAKGHLEQAISAHTRGDWASANAQLRSFIESLFDSIAAELVVNKETLPKPGHQRRELLAKLSPPFLAPALNEWEIGDKGGFLQGVWRRLHPQGSHPGLSDEEDSTFRLHLVILAASHYLKRLDTIKGNP
jgi:hypothetical protein